jgi:hypothetical protein
VVAVSLDTGMQISLQGIHWGVSLGSTPVADEQRKEQGCKVVLTKSLPIPQGTLDAGWPCRVVPIWRQNLPPAVKLRISPLPDGSPTRCAWIVLTDRMTLITWGFGPCQVAYDNNMTCGGALGSQIQA